MVVVQDIRTTVVIGRITDHNTCLNTCLNIPLSTVGMLPFHRTGITRLNPDTSLQSLRRFMMTRLESGLDMGTTVRCQIHNGVGAATAIMTITVAIIVITVTTTLVASEI